MPNIACMSPELVLGWNTTWSERNPMISRHGFADPRILLGEHRMAAEPRLGENLGHGALLVDHGTPDRSDPGEIEISRILIEVGRELRHCRHGPTLVVAGSQLP